ncbi:hypothetical protein BH11ACT3_BH11ACT3_01150 [soil metagenome]
MADKTVDPRFDPRFQRGYVGPASPPSRSASRQQSIVVTPAQPRSVEIPYPTPAQSADPRVNRVAVPSPDAGAAEHEPPRRNPFRLALLLSSLAAIVAGVAAFASWLANSSRGYNFGPNSDPLDYVWWTFTNLAPAPLLLAGLLGVIVWVVLGAVQPATRTADA